MVFLDMLNKLSRVFVQSRAKPVVVTFTGGMGAQVISAAIYFALRKQGRETYADLSYFDKSERVAAVGEKGVVSHWSWQLESFGLTLASFETAPGLARHQIELIVDGPRKLELGLQGLRDAEVQGHFAIQGGVEDILPAEFSAAYVCVHVRRGDYVNVGSTLVSEEKFVELAGKLAVFAGNLVVVSDSPIGAEFRQRISVGYEHAEFLDEIDAFTTHRIMRKASALICSNSQFSLIAALLNSRALVFFPKRWFVPGQHAIEQLINESSEFQILDSVRDKP
jgi:hypothetical protein